MLIGIGTPIPLLSNLPGQGNSPVIDPRFITEWTVSAGQTLNLYGYTGVVYDYDIDWGDGNTETSATMTQPGGASYQIKSHTYTNAGTYEIKITGDDFKGLFMRGAWSGAGYANDPDSRLALVNLKNWGTCKIYDLHQSYYHADNMAYTAIDRPILDNFYAAGSVKQAFSFCAKITNLNLTGWLDTDKFKRHDQMMYMDYTLADSLLEEIDLTGWDFSNSSTIINMCQAVGMGTANGCDITIPNVVTSSNSVSTIFGQAYINSLNVPNWDIGSGGGVNCYRLFWGTIFSTTQEVDLSTWTLKPSGFADFARGAGNINKFNFSGWDTSICTTFELMFYFVPELEEIVGLEDFDATSAITIRGMFSACYQLHFTNHNFGTNWGPNLGSCTNFQSTFNQTGYNIVGSKAGPDVSDWDTSNAPSFASMFYRTAGWNTQLDISNWDVGNSTSFDAMFRESSSIQDLDCSLWNVGQNTGTSVLNFANLCRGANTQTAVFGPNCNFTYNTTFFTIFYGAPIVSWEFDWATANFQECLEWRSMLLPSGAMTTSQYDEFLQVIVNTNSKINESMYMGSSTYSAAPSAGATAHNTLDVTRGWTISDGGPV